MKIKMKNKYFLLLVTNILFLQNIFGQTYKSKISADEYRSMNIQNNGDEVLYSINEIDPDPIVTPTIFFNPEEITCDNNGQFTTHNPERTWFIPFDSSNPTVFRQEVRCFSCECNVSGACTWKVYASSAKCQGCSECQIFPVPCGSSTEKSGSSGGVIVIAKSVKKQ